MMAANIAFGPRQRGERLSEQIAMLLERVGLPGYQERDASNLSEDEAQPVSPARALLANLLMALLLKTNGPPRLRSKMAQLESTSMSSYLWICSRFMDSRPSQFCD
jgi:ABC-type thiamine transport system ATPase subunit